MAKSQAPKYDLRLSVEKRKGFPLHLISENPAVVSGLEEKGSSHLFIIVNR